MTKSVDIGIMELMAEIEMMQKHVKKEILAIEAKFEVLQRMLAAS